MTKSTAMAAPFLEYHYYNDGLQIESVHKESRRPEWAPPAEKVGLNDEFSLSPEDMVVELARFQSGKSIATWFALHKFATDAQFGARNLYAGLGVWYLDRLIHKPRNLFQTLNNVQQVFEPGDIDLALPEMRSCLGDRSGFLDVPTVAADGLPAQFQGLKPTSGLSKVELKEVSTNVQNLEALIADAILTAQLVPSKSKASKLLIKVSPNAGIEKSDVELIKAPKFASAIAAQIPSAIRDQEEHLALARRQYRELQANNEQSQAANEELRTELEATKIDLRAADQNSRKFEQLLNESDEHKKHKAIIKEIASIRTAVENSTATQRASNSKLQTKISNDLAKIDSLSTTVTQINRKVGSDNSAGASPNPPHGQRSEGGMRHGSRRRSVKCPPWYVWAILGTFLVMLILYFALRGTWGGEEAEASSIAPLDIGEGSRVGRDSDAVSTTVPEGMFLCTPTDINAVLGGDGPIACKEGVEVGIQGYIPYNDPANVPQGFQQSLPYLQRIVGEQSLFCEGPSNLTQEMFVNTFCRTSRTDIDLTCEMLSARAAAPSPTLGDHCQN